MKDANGTSFHLMLGRRDWQAALTHESPSSVIWDQTAGAAVLRPETKHFPPRVGAVRLSPEDRRGADRDGFGNWYWITEDRRGIRTWRIGGSAADFFDASTLEQTACPPKDGSFADSAPPEPAFADLTLSGLSVSCRHFLLVGTLTPNGFLLFDLHSGGTPTFQPRSTPAEIAVRDLARAHDGGTWILDRTGPADAGRVWKLDERFCLEGFAGATALPLPAPPDFTPEGAPPEPVVASEFPRALDLGASGPTGVPGAAAPVSVASLPDETFLILDAPEGVPSRILRYSPDGAVAEVTLDQDKLREFEDPPLAYRGHDIAFVANLEAPPGRLEGALLIVDDHGDQALHFDLTADSWAPEAPAVSELSLTLAPDYLPMRHFAGRALVEAGGKTHYDLGETWIALAPHPRQNRLTEGTIRPAVFDSGQPGTVWHRIIFDGCVAPGTTVTLSVRAADSPDALLGTEWSVLPRPYKRGDGAETPHWSPFPDADPESAAGSYETLIQSAEGRFLQLGIDLTGNGSTTPRLRALRIYMPRFSYLDRYLPAVYREDEVSGDFLERFLANVEGLFTSMEDRVATAHGLWDTRIAPPEALDWLATWMGAALETDWDDARRRLFIDHVELLFRWRGTPAGLKAMIDIATDPCPDECLFDGLKSGNPPEPDGARQGVRLSETHALHAFKSVTPDPVETLVDWTYEDGAEALHQAFAAFALDRRGTTVAELSTIWGESPALQTQNEIRFTPLVPANPAKAEDWRAFAAGPIGFIYAAATAADTIHWQAYLTRRHGAPDRVAAAHGLTSADPHPLSLPASLPPGGPRLEDWIAFVSAILPVERDAHRFTVLAPVYPGEDRQRRDDRIGQIARVVERERPLHTAYEVRPYWALFQTGSARLGLDTALSDGARFTAIELGRSALSEGFIGYGHPFAVRDRTVVGRDATGEVRL